MCRKNKYAIGDKVWFPVWEEARECEVIKAPRLFAKEKVYKVLMLDKKEIITVEESEIVPTIGMAEKQIWENAKEIYFEDIKPDVPLSKQLRIEEFPHWVTIYFREIVGIPCNAEPRDPKEEVDE